MDRRLLLGASALAILSAKAAKADTAFTSFAFAATGGSASRTDPDRWSDVKNVKDFGATGNGSTDDTAAIQAAVNWTSGANRGTIYFPPGTYKVTSSITYNYNGALSICFRGEQGLSTITGNFAGFILDRTLSPSDNPTGGGRVIEKLTISNGNAAGGGIRMGSTVGGSIRDCTVSAWQAIWACDSDGGAAQSVVIENCVVSSGGLGGASNGIVVSANCAVIACDVTGFNAGIRAFGVGPCISGCRLEVNTTGIILGLLPDGTNAGLSGFTIQGGSFESNGTAIDFAGGSGHFLIAGLIIQGFEGAAPSGGNPQYGIRVRADAAQYGHFTGISVGGQYQIASIAVGNTTNRNGLVFSGVHANNVSTLGGVSWTLPTTAHTAEWINCDILPTFLFAGMPVSSNLREGDQYYITDANTATLGNAVTAGGAPNTHGYITWNGTAWTLTSK